MSKRMLAILAAITAAGGVVIRAYNRELAQIRKRVAEGSRMAQTSTGPIEYAVRGSGAPVLVIHGAGGGYDQGLFIAESLPQGLQLIAPSRFGYLRTPVPGDASIEAQADAHAALLDNLGIDRAIVVAASAGAPSAVEFALRHPTHVRALILLVPRGYAPTHTVEVPRNWSNEQVLKVIESGADFAYWLTLRVARSKLVRFMGVPPELEARAPAAERERVNELLRSVLPLSLRIEGINNDSATPMTPLPLQQIKLPTLIITAKDDLFETLPAAEFMAKRIPGAKFIVFESGGHLLLERQQEVNAAITEFIRSLEPVRASPHRLAG